MKQVNVSSLQNLLDRLSSIHVEPFIKLIKIPSGYQAVKVIRNNDTGRDVVFETSEITSSNFQTMASLASVWANFEDIQFIKQEEQDVKAEWSI